MDNLDKLGQHFMTDETMLKTMVENADLSKNDVVLEIGFGKGSLTKMIAEKCNVIAIDVDESFKIDIKNVKVVYGNILEEIEKLKFSKIISNIPYSISEPLFKKLFKIDFDLCILTIGENFYKILEDEKSKLGIISNALFKIEKISDVNKKSFFPIPKVNSVLIKITPRPEKDKIISELIKQDDKKVKNALENIIVKSGKSKYDAVKIVKNLGINEIVNKKLWQLTNEEFLEVYTKIKRL